MLDLEKLELSVASAFAICFWNFALASALDIPVGITNSEVRIKICVINAGIKKKSVIKKKGQKTW